MKFLTHIPSLFTNKYFIAVAVFAAIMLFFDKNDIFTQLSRNRQLKELQQSKLHYTKEVADLEQVRDELIHNIGTIEQYAREKFLMKRDNEDLYVIPENYAGSKN
ncbi:MAG: septum formation initiator family protein [Bacteroidota bacterium]